MKEIRFFHVDAFTDQPFGGNPAGVVPDATGLTEVDMQNIARELNLSETAFIFPLEDRSDSDFRVRYYTPTSEIDFCGHATLSLAWVLFTEWAEKAEVIRLTTNIGVIPVQSSIGNGKLTSVMMTQVAPKVKEFEVDLEGLCKLIGVSEEDIDDRYPLKLGYTGNWHLLVPIKTRKAIDAANPLIEELGHLNKQYNISTTHLFTFDSAADGLMIYTRDFAPAVGIPEDPVTGSANGALAGYLLLEGILDKNVEHQFKIGQGHSIGRPGFLDIVIRTGEEAPIIQVGGKAVPIIQGVIRL